MARARVFVRGALVFFLGWFCTAVQPQETEKYVPQQVLVKLKREAQSAAAGASLRQTLRATVRRSFPSIAAELWEIQGLSVADAVAQFRSDSRFEYIEPNYRVYAIRSVHESKAGLAAALVPNDPQFTRLWGLHNTGQTGGAVDADIDAAEAWEIETGKNVVVGIIDTGIDWQHPDLAQNIWTNPGEIPNNGIDDDRNGYIDDVRGWDFYNNDNSPFDGDGHGTHVAGTVAAVGNNGIGVTGVSWSAKLMALKFLSDNGLGATADALSAIEYAVRNGAQITNNSWGGDEFSQALYDAIAAAGQAGLLFIASAGNDGANNDLFPKYPSNYDLNNIIAVAATNHSDQLASFSNYGRVSVDLGAPGDEILSTVPGNGYVLASGTSMAAPHVAGAASLILSRVPALTQVQVKDLIMRTTDPLPGLQGRTVSGGRLNVHQALILAEPDSIPPAAINNLSINISKSNSIALTWIASGDDGNNGRAAQYDLRYATTPITAGNFTQARTAANVPRPQAAGAQESFAVTGLDFNTTYYFAVQVKDEQGNVSGVSNSPAATTLGIPDIAIAPAALAETLLTGAVSARTLRIFNRSQGTLDFTLTPFASWLSVAPRAGTVHAGESLAVALNFDAAGLNGNNYKTSITINSNDPDERAISVPVQLRVIGAPDIALSLRDLDFGRVLIGDTAVIKLKVSNPGTEVLIVRQISAGTVVVTIVPDSFNIGPKQAQEVAFSFLPAAAGEVSGAVRITSNDPDERELSLPWRGEGLEPPEIVLSADSMFAQLFTGQTAQQTLAIANIGASDLRFTLEIANVKVPVLSLKARRIAAAENKTSNWCAQLQQAAQQAVAGIHWQPLKSEGQETPDAVERQTLAQFRQQLAIYADRVKRLRAQITLPSLAVAGAFSYRLIYDVLNHPDLPAKYIFTDIGDHYVSATLQGYDGVLVNEADFALTLDEAQALRLFADAGKPVFLGMDDLDNTGSAVQNEIFPMFGIANAADRNFVFGSLNPQHPITAGVSVVDNFDDGDNDVFTLNGGDWIFSDPQGNYFGVSHQLRTRTVLIGEFLSGVWESGPNNPKLLANAIDWMMAAGAGWVQLETASGILPPGERLEIAITFDAARLRGGDYTADLTVVSNDPDEKRSVLPIHLAVAGAPDIAVQPDSLNFGGIFIGASAALTIEVQNLGTEDLLITSATADQPAYTITPRFAGVNPGEKQIFTARFRPVAPGEFPGSLTLANNDPDQPAFTVALHGEGLIPPRISAAPDSFSFSLTSGVSAAAIMTLSNRGGSALNFSIQDEQLRGPANAAGQKLYWAKRWSTAPDTLRRSDRNGSRRENLLSANGTFNGIAIDEQNGRVYWADESNGAIRASNLDGSDAKILISGLGLLVDVEVDGAGGKIYWTDFSRGTINRANLDGSGVTVIVQGNGPGPSFAESGMIAAPASGQPPLPPQWQNAQLLNPWGLGLDLMHGKVYWTEQTGNRIGRANLDGSQSESIIATGVSGPRGIKVDARGGKIYFIDSFNQEIKRANLDGSRVETVLALGVTLNPLDLELDVAAQELYFTDNTTDQIQKANFNGGSLRVVVTDPAFSFSGVFGLALLHGKDWLTEAPAQGEIPAGGRADIELKVRTAGLTSGDYGAQVQIQSNDPLATKLNVPVHLHVIGAPNLSFSPDTLKFGEIFLGASARDTLLIANLGSDSLQVFGFSSNHSAFMAPAGGLILGPGKQQIVSVIFQPDAAGTISGVLAISSNDRKRPLATVALLGQGVIPPDIEVQPETLRAALHSGNDTTQTLIISNTGGSALQWNIAITFSGQLQIAQRPPALPLTSIISKKEETLSPVEVALPRAENLTPAWLTVSPQSGSTAAGASSQAVVRFNAAGLNGGDYLSRLVITSNDPRKPRLVTPAQLHVTGAPQIAVSADSLHFGKVFLGASVQDTLLVINPGTEMLQAGSIVVNQSTYTANPARFNLAPGDTQLVAVRFAPTTIGNHDALMTITSNAVGRPEYRIVLRGESFEPPVISVTPSSFNFKARVKDTLSAAMTISNTGKSVLQFQIKGTSQYLFWSETPGTLPDKLQRSSLTGQNVQNIFTRSAAQLRGVAVDDPGQRVYWLDRGEGLLRSSTLGGDDVRVLVRNLQVPVDIALDAMRGKMYWTDFGRGTINSANLDGSDVRVLVQTAVNAAAIGPDDEISSGPAAGAALGTPWGIALDLVRNKIYWTEESGNRIQRANLDGSRVETIVASGLNGPRGIKLDAESGKIYFVDSFNRVIKRADLEGNRIETLIAGLSNPLDLELDTASRHLYWTDNVRHQIQRMNFDGSNVTVIAGRPQLTNPSGIALLSQGGWLSATPERGTVPPNFSRTIKVRADATQLGPGEYRADFLVSSNDPKQPEVTVPVHLQVRDNDLLLALPDSLRAAPGDLIEVPITLTFQNRDFVVAALGAALKATGNLLTFESFVHGPIAPGNALRVHALAADSVRLAFTDFGSGPIAQSGLLATLRFRVANHASAGATAVWQFSELSAVEPNTTPLSLLVATGKVTVIEVAGLAGRVNYCRRTANEPARPVSGMPIALLKNGAAFQETRTGAAGNFNFDLLAPGSNYRLDLPPQNMGGDSALTVTDALLAFSAFLGEARLQGCQKLAADVDSNFVIQPADALLIFNYYLGKIAKFPAGVWRPAPASYDLDATPETWKTAPLSIAHQNLRERKQEQNFQVLVRGDVDLSWPRGSRLSPAIISGANASLRFSIMAAPISPHATHAVIQIHLAGAALPQGLYAFGGELEYDAAVFAITAVRWGAIVPDEGFELGYHLAAAYETGKPPAAPAHAKLGQLRFGGFSTSAAVRTAGTLLEIEARVQTPLAAAVSLPLRLRHLTATGAVISAGATLGKGQAGFEEIEVAGQDGAVAILARPVEFALAPNYPNPFNPTTQIRYQLPEAATVSLEIFNALGQKVRTLVPRQIQEAGYYELAWDSRNESGEPLTSGIYFYRLQAHTAARHFMHLHKMALLR